MESLLRLPFYHLTDINIQYTESYRNGVLSILTFPFSVHSTLLINELHVSVKHIKPDNSV